MARQKAQRPTAAQQIESARAAALRARARLDAREGVEPQVDIRRAPLSWWRERWHDKATRRQFIENFIKVRDAFEKNKVVPMVFNDFQADYHERKTAKDVRLKPRRLGSSVYELAADFCDALVLSNQHVRIVPHDPDTEEEFFDALQVMYENLPDHLRVETTSFTKRLIKFRDPAKGTINSKIKSSTVQPGHEGKGRGQAITHLRLTEVPHWRGDAKKAATSLIEAAQGGQITVESTPFGLDWFHSIYQDGKTGKGGWSSHFYQWWWKRDYRVEGCYFVERNRDHYLFNPGEPYAAVNRHAVTSEERKISARILVHLTKLGHIREGSKWRAPEVAEYLAWRRRKIDDIGEQTFKVEYPENDRDCFTQTGRPLIRAEYLAAECEPSAPVEGHDYLVAADVSLGLQSGDPAAVQVLDIHSGRQCREVSLTIAPDLLAVKLGELSDEYGGAQIVVERNGPGIATIIKLIELGYEDRLYKHLDAKRRRAVEDGRLDIDEAMRDAQHGFPTTAETKPLIGVKLEEGIRTGALGLSSEEFCTECRSVVWFDDRSWGALPGHHDDRVVALAIGWYVARTQMGLTGFVGVMPEGGYAR